MELLRKYFGDSIGSILVNKYVGSVFGVLLIVWMVLELQVLPDSVVRVLLPVWIPSYVAFVIADSVRSMFTLVSNSIVFGMIIILVTYIESIVIGNVVRFGVKYFA